MTSPSASWLAEARALGRIASAVTVTMLAQLALGTVETVVVARLGTDVLAGVALAFGLQLLVFLFALGTVTAVTPLAAAAMGQGDPDEAGRIGQAGVGLGLLVSLPGAVLLLLLAASLSVLLPPGPEIPSAIDYLFGVAVGLPAWVMYVALRCLAVATDAVRSTTVATLAGVPVHAGLVAWLTLGGAGLPPLGAFGAGLAHAVTGYAVLAVLALAVRWRRRSVLAAVLGTWPAWDRVRGRALLRLGLPFACRILLREGVMPAATLLLVPFGPDALASHAVVVRATELLGVVAFGLSDATNARVAHALGAGKPGQVRQSAKVAVQVAVLVGVVVALVVLVLPMPVLAVILGSTSPDTLDAVLTVLPAASAFLFLEIVMSAVGGALAGLRDAMGPLVVAIAGAWVVGLPVGRWLAGTVALPALGMWCGLLAGALLTTFLLLLRLRARVPSL